MPPFVLAYDQELGQVREPILDQMRVVVSVHKARPLFPEVWKNSNPAIQRLRETMEDSWDADGEARVTAVCVLERARELTGLWEQYNHRHRFAPNNCSGGGGALPRGAAVTIPALQQQLHFQNNQLDLRKSHGGRGHEGGGNVDIPVKNDNVLSKQQPLVQLQPHQGRNPCMERNNRMGAGDGDSQEAPLVLRSFKDSRQSEAEAADHRVNIEELEEEVVAPNDTIRSIAQPISYLKNDFFSQTQPRRLFQKKMPPIVKQPKVGNINHDREQQLLLESSRASTSSSCNPESNTGGQNH